MGGVRLGRVYVGEAVLVVENEGESVWLLEVDDECW